MELVLQSLCNSHSSMSIIDSEKTASIKIVIMINFKVECDGEPILVIGSYQPIVGATRVPKDIA